MSIETVVSLQYSKDVNRQTIFDAFFDDAVTRKRLISIQSYNVPYNPGKDIGVMMTPESEETGIDDPSIQAIHTYVHNLLTQDHPYYIEVAFGLPRHIETFVGWSERDRRAQYKVKEGRVRGELHLYSSERSPIFNLPAEFETGLLYAAGNMGYYLQDRMGKEAAQDNLIALADELRVFIDTGARALVGFDADTSLNPAQWMLQYQSDWVDYFSKKFHKDVSHDALIEAYLSLETDTFVEMGSSVLLFSATGHLHEFYKRILE